MTAALRVFLCSALWPPSLVRALDIFAQQQILSWKETNQKFPGAYNTTAYGATVIDDTWSQLDYEFSPMEGWSLLRYVGLGCFEIPAFPMWFLTYSNSSLTEEAGLEGFHCCKFCLSQKLAGATNSSQAYFKYPTCYCGDAETLPLIAEKIARHEECFDPFWKVFREYDFHTLQASVYDVPRRLVVQQVAVRVPTAVDPSGLRHYLHAVNAMEQLPAFHRTYLLERRTFNIVWDFAHTDMVGLSYNAERKLELTFVHYNTSTGMLVADHRYVPVEDDILNFIPEQKRTVFIGGCDSCGSTFGDGLSVVDIIYGTYWFAVPMIQEDTAYGVSHAIVAYDLVRMELKGVWMTNKLLVNLQVDGLQHVLYATGSNWELGTFEFMEVCRSIATTEIHPVEYNVECEANPATVDLGPNFSSSYLQSVAMDHKQNRTYMTYVSNSSSRPRILEYDTITGESVPWNENVLNETTVFASLVQTVPKLIFALEPPDLLEAKFSPDGERIEVLLTRDSLRGSVPFDTNGDEIPEGWDEAEKKDYSLCADFFDDFTLRYIGQNSMCDWLNDRKLIIFLTSLSDCYLEDMIRIRKSVLWAGETLTTGMNVFSLPSSSFTLLLPPDDIPYPEIYITSVKKVDECTELTMDGSGTITNDYKVRYEWSLSYTSPPSTQAHLNAIQKVILDQRPSDTTRIEAAVVTIPPNLMIKKVRYVFALTVTSYWNATFSSVEYKDVLISHIAVPPINLYGPGIIEAELAKGFGIASMAKESACAPDSDRMSYAWSGCIVPEDVMAKDVDCGFEWQAGMFDLDRISGKNSRSLYFMPLAITGPVGRLYKITLLVTLLDNNFKPTVSNNTISMLVKTLLGPLVPGFRSGTSFQTFTGHAIVLDATVTHDPSDPHGNVRAGMTYTFACAQSDMIGVPPKWRDCFHVNDDEYRMWDGDANVPTVCEFGANPQTFLFHGKEYTVPDWTVVSQWHRWCVHPTEPDIVMVKPHSLTPGLTYNFTLSVSKVIDAFARHAHANLIVQTTSVQLPEVYIQAKTKPYFTPWTPLKLEAIITNASPEAIIGYEWSFYEWAINPDWDHKRAAREKEEYTVPKFVWEEVTLEYPEQLGTLPGSTFVINSNTLKAGTEYKVTVNVTDNERAGKGTSEYVLRLIGQKPHSGYLTVEPMFGYALQTKFKLSMSRWESDDMPLSYRIAYNEKYTDPLSEEHFLSFMFSPQHTIEDVVLPAGHAHTNYTVQLYGFVQTPYGAVAFDTVDVHVHPPRDAEAVQAGLYGSLNKQDAETQLATIVKLTTMQPTLNMLDNMVLLMKQNAAYLPETPGAVQGQVQALGAVCASGKQDDDVVDYVDDLVQASIAKGYISTDADGIRGMSTLTQSLMTTTSTILNDTPPPRAQRRRRMQSRNWTDATTTGRGRSPALRLAHMNRVRAMHESVFRKALQGLLKGEKPAVIQTLFFNVYFGKAPTLTKESPYAQNPVMDIPPTGGDAMPDIGRYLAVGARGLARRDSVYSYMYVDFQTWPYNALVTVPNTTTMESTGVTGWPYSLDDQGKDPFIPRRVPMQHAKASWGRLWRATTVLIGDGDGNSLGEAWNDARFVKNFSDFYRTLTPDKSLVLSRPVRDVASSCFALDVQDDHVVVISEGIVVDRGSCASDKLHRDYIYLADDLPQDLTFQELVGSEVVREAVDKYGTATLSTTLVVLWVVAIVAAVGGQFVDKKQTATGFSDDHLIVDSLSVARKFFFTLRNVFYRDHVIVAYFAVQCHRYIARDERSALSLTAMLLLLTFSTAFHWNASFCELEGHVSSTGTRNQCTMPFHGNYFIVSGLMSAILAFPLITILHVMFVCRPKPKISHNAPPPPAIPISALEKNLNTLPIYRQKMLTTRAPDLVPVRIAPPLLDVRPPPSLHTLERVCDLPSAKRPEKLVDATIPKPPAFLPRVEPFRLPLLPQLSTELPDGVTPSRPLKFPKGVPRPPAASPPPHIGLMPAALSDRCERGVPAPPPPTFPLSPHPSLPLSPASPRDGKNAAYEQHVRQRRRYSSANPLEVSMTQMHDQVCEAPPPPPAPQQFLQRPPSVPSDGPILRMPRPGSSFERTPPPARRSVASLPRQPQFEGSHFLPPAPEPPKKSHHPAFLHPPGNPDLQQPCTRSEELQAKYSKVAHHKASKPLGYDARVKSTCPASSSSNPMCAPKPPNPYQPRARFGVQQPPVSGASHSVSPARSSTDPGVRRPFWVSESRTEALTAPHKEAAAATLPLGAPVPELAPEITRKFAPPREQFFQHPQQGASPSLLPSPLLSPSPSSSPSSLPSSSPRLRPSPSFDINLHISTSSSKKKEVAAERAIFLSTPELGEMPPAPPQPKPKCATRPKHRSASVRVPSLHLVAPMRRADDVPVLPPRMTVLSAPTPPKVPPPGAAILFARSRTAPTFPDTEEEVPVKYLKWPCRAMRYSKPASEHPVPPPQPVQLAPMPPTAAPPTNTRQLARDAFDRFVHQRKIIESTGVDSQQPVPDAIVIYAPYVVQCMMFWICAACTFYVHVLGVPLRAKQQFATHMSFAVAFVLFFGAFESVKCILVTFVLLSREEARRRLAIKEARRIRMTLKSQVLEDTVRVKGLPVCVHGVAREAPTRR